MKNQHKLISGYRDLTQAEIDLVNEGKRIGHEVEQYLLKLQRDSNTDKRSVSFAIKFIQTGFMWAARSVMKPESLI